VSAYDMWRDEAEAAMDQRPRDKAPSPKVRRLTAQEIRELGTSGWLDRPKSERNRKK
jgi:hypothetical protein